MPRERFLGVFKSYPGTAYHLPGVLRDYERLAQLTLRMQSYWSSVLLLDRPRTSIEVGLLHVDPSLVWFCGHGMIHDNVNVFLLEPAENDEHDFFTNKQLAKFVEQSTRTRTLYVFDFCHSCTMLNLKYYYTDGQFFEKVLPTEPTVLDDNKNRLIIAISGATDFSTAHEDAGGGRLTQFIADLLDQYGYFTVRMFDALRPAFLNKTVVSTNRLFDPDMRLIDISPKILQEQSFNV